jgi:outer membrane scaffolding protein for murein synthesis (MipA/OmpV family)
LLLAALLPGLAAAEPEKPLWELGLGAAGLSFPAYRGAAEQRFLALPLPYFVYRGEFFKADREGIRGMLFDTDRIELTLSLSASPPSDSDEAEARAGMPDLEPSVEFGPQVNLTLWRSADRARFLKLRLPMRAALTVESSPQAIGWIFSPNLNMDITDLPAMPGWNLGMFAGPIWASRKQHAYFYDVPAEFATADRPAYAAPGGYSGTQFLAALSKRYERMWVGAYLRYDTLRGVAFEDSPLVERRHFLTAGIGLAWILGESGIRVEANE